MTKEIINALGRRQVFRNHTPVIANVIMIFPWEVDLFSVNRSGYTYEFEVKISRQDFLKDSKKKKWDKQKWLPELKTPNYMSYVCPEGLIKIDEIVEFAGLYYYKEGEITEVREPKLRHETKRDINEINMKCARLHSQREFLGCSLLTHENAEIKKRNDAREAERKKQQFDWDAHMKKNKEIRESTGMNIR